ncbi:hypothetical protein NKG05_21035 [Oerskovia sp. M15]
MTRSLETHAVVATNLTILGGPDRLRGRSVRKTGGSGPRTPAAQSGTSWASSPQPPLLRVRHGCPPGRPRRDPPLPRLPHRVARPVDRALREPRPQHRAPPGAVARASGARENQTPDRPRGPGAVLGSRWLLVRALGDLHRRTRATG